MRDDSSAQVHQSVNRKRDHVAVRTLWNQCSAPEEALECFEDVDPIIVLVRLKQRGHQPAPGPLQIRMRSYADAEAPFGVDETSHIPGVERPFLLIVCTRRIFTAHRRSSPRSRWRVSSERVARDSQTFQHTARFCNGLWA